MPDYQLEIKQIVDYPRCRIYRQFIQSLIKDWHFRTSGGSGLFYFAVLSSYANFRTSYRRIDGIPYTIYPGEWLCTLKELSEWFHTPFQYQALRILEDLQKQHLISFHLVGRGKIVKYKICGWKQHNSALDYNCPCQKDTGFFFMPISIATELISSKRCSEMDIVLDLWLSTVYNDNQVLGSDVGPVVYLRNGTGNPLVNYAEMAERWGISKATVGRILKKFVDQDYISLMSFPGRCGSVIYLRNYLSTMFQISDVIINKDEVAMLLNIKIQLPESETDAKINLSLEHKICGSETLPSVSKLQIEIIIQKLVQILSVQGVACFNCSKSKYKLYPLSDACGEKYLYRAREAPEKRFGLTILCGDDEPVYTFTLTLSPYVR